MPWVQSDTQINLYVFLLTSSCVRPGYAHLYIDSMSSFTYLLLEGQKAQMDVHPDEINAVPISMPDGSTIYAVAGIREQRKLFKLQQLIDIDIAA